MNLEELYKSVLEFAGCSVSDSGYIQCFNGKKYINVIIDGKDLIFPTINNQRNPPENTVMFHPLAENDIGAESPVLARLRELTFLRFNMVTSNLMNDLISVLNSQEIHSKLTGEAQNILYQGIEVDKNSKLALNSIITDSKDPLNKLFINGWLRRGGTVAGRTYSRACITAFTLYSRLADAEFQDNLPKRVRKHDPQAIRKLLKYIFPNIEDTEKYNNGSDSRVAPFFEAFLKTAKTIADDLQSTLDNFSKYLVDAAEYSFATEWMSIIDNLESMRGQIALIPNQTGITLPAQQLQQPQQAAAPQGLASLAAMMQQNNQVINTPAQASVQNTTGKRSIADLAANNPQLAANTMLQGNNLMAQNGNGALQALLSGMTPNAGGLQALQQMLNSQQQQSNELVKALGHQGAMQANALMQAGVSRQDAVMQVLASKPPQPTQEQIAAQLLAQQLNPQGNAAMLAAALGASVGNTQIPVGYPAGDIVEVGGIKYMKVNTGIGGVQFLPLP